MIAKLFNKVKDLTKKPHKHHIVAQFAPMAAPARTVLRSVDIGVNSEANYVMLSPKFHWYLHTNIYYGLVNWQVIDAYAFAGENKQEAVGDRLEEIRNFLIKLDQSW